jgi:hypothetical protein
MHPYVGYSKEESIAIGAVVARVGEALEKTMMALEAFRCFCCGLNAFIAMPDALNLYWPRSVRQGRDFLNWE